MANITMELKLFRKGVDYIHNANISAHNATKEAKDQQQQIDDKLVIIWTISSLILHTDL